MRKFVTITAALAASIGLFGIQRASAVELLGNGNLEESVSPPGWIQTETITGMPGTPIALSEHVFDGHSEFDLAENPLGILVRTRSGNTGAFMDQNKMIN